MSRKYVPPFATLAVVENGGGAYTRDATISLAIRPSLPVKLDLIVSRVESKHEASLSARRRDVPDTTGRHGIKRPQQDFALKMQGGICGTLRYI